jgi:nucleoside-diphosphate-sugar epimerase
MPPTWPHVEIAPGDLNDTASLERACVGIDTVFHLAGFAHADAADTPDFAARHWAINAEGTFHLLNAAAVAGIKRFIFLSSIKAAGDPGWHCVNESWNTLPTSPYGRAKRAAEERALAVGRSTGMSMVILRPALVYGPGMKGNLPRLIKAVQKGWLPPLPETGNRRSLVHVDDVVQAMLLAAIHPAAAGQTYLITDSQPYSGHELYLLIRRARNLAEPHWTISAPVLYGTAHVADRLLRLIGRGHHPFRNALGKLLDWACYDSAKIRQELGYRPVWNLERALPDLTKKLVAEEPD